MRPSRIQFSTKVECQFNCSFCVYNPDFHTYLSFDMGDFLSFSKKFYDFGVREFELTPVTGESLLDPYLFTKVKHLSSLGAEKIIIFTNAYGLDDMMIERLASHPEIELNISIYGGTKEEFKERTGVDGYAEVCTNIGKALTHEMNLVLHKRYSGKTNPRMQMWFKVAEELDMPVWDCSHDTDWHDMRKSDNVELAEGYGVCRFALEDNAVLPNGDIILCGWFDVDGRMVIGNINDQELSQIYGEDSMFAEIIKKQEKGVYTELCASCTMKYDKRNKYPDN